MIYSLKNSIAALVLASGFVAGAAAAVTYETTGQELINRPTVQTEEVASMTICFGAVRDNYVEPDSDYSCSAML